VSFGSVQIGGSVRIGPDVGPDGSDDGAQPTKLVAVPFRDLLAVHGDFVLEDTQHITTPALGSLRRVLGDLVLRRNAGLTDVNLFDLVEVGGDLIIEDNAVLDSIINTEPARIGGDLVVRNVPLVTCAMVQPLIDATAGSVTIEGLAEPCP